MRADSPKKKDNFDINSSQQQCNQLSPTFSSKYKIKNSSQQSSQLSESLNIKQYFSQLYSHALYSDQPTPESSQLAESFHDRKNSFQLYPASINKYNTFQGDLTMENALSQIKLQTAIDRLIIEQKILESGVFMKCNNFENQLTILGIVPSKYYQVVTLQLQLSCFKTKFQIFNSQSAYHIHDQAHLGGEGAFGIVYYMKFLHQLYAVKCVLFNKNAAQYKGCISQMKKIFIAALKEYFFVLMFSVLEIGPKAKKIMGFDMVLSKDCIEFSTQLCTNHKMDSSDILSMKKCLRMMHALNIVHRDIKPDHIMFSNSFKKHVLVDFGGCCFLQQPIGNKTLTNFLGTAGFCTDEMFQLLATNKGYVDLYFNDFYGLQKTTQKYEKYKASIPTQNIFYYEKQKSHSGIESIASSFALLTLTKYFAYNHLHIELLDNWKIIQKRQAIQLEQIIIEFLKFLIEVEPDGKLMDFYHKFIADAVKVSQDFNELCKVFENSFMDPLAYWRQIPSNAKSFSDNFFFYELACIDYGNYTEIEKKILKILLSKQSIQDFVFRKIQTNTEGKRNKRSKASTYLSQQHKEQKYFNEFIDFALYFLVVVSYCTFTQNKYKIDFSDKLKAAELALSIFSNEKILPITERETFYCHTPELKPLTKLFSYYMLQIWVKVPPIFQAQSMKTCVSSLYLLGYPTYIYNAKLVIGYQIAKSSLSRNQKIINVWIFNVILINFNDILYNRRKDTQFFCRFQKDQIDKSYKELISQEGDEKQSFYALNSYFFTEIYQNFDKIDEQKIKIAVKLLEKDYSFKQISKEDFEKWKKLMYFMLKYLADVFQIMFKEFELNWLKEFNISILKNTRLDLPYLFCLTYSKSYFWNSKQKLTQIIEIADEIIKCQQISFRYLPYCRINAYYQSQDYKNLKKVLIIVYENALSDTIINLGTLNTSVVTIKDLIVDHTKKFEINFTDYEKQEQLFKDIVQQALKLAIFYSNYQDQRNPLKSLMKDTHQQNLKSIISIINNLQDLLYTLKEIFSCYVKVKQRKQKKFHFLTNSKSFDTCIDPNYEAQIFLIQNILNNVLIKIDLKPYLKNERNSMNEYVAFAMNFYLKQREFSSAILAFEQIFGILTFNDIANDKLKTPPIIRTYAVYCMLKTINSVDKFWDHQLLEVYQICRQQSSLINPLKDPLIYRAFLQALIYCNTNFQQIEGFIIFILEFIKNAPTKINAEKLPLIFQSFLRCACQNCFPRSYLDWNPLAFANYMEKRILAYDYRNFSYISLIFNSFFEFQEASASLKLNCFNFIRKCLKYLSYPIQLTVTDKLDTYAINYFAQVTGLKFYFQRIIKLTEKRSNVLHQIEAPILNEIRENFDAKVLKKHIHLLVRVMRRQKRNGISQSYLKEIIYREKILKDWFLPRIVRQLVSKKLKRYYVVKKSFQIYHDSE